MKAISGMKGGGPIASHSLYGDAVAGSRWLRFSSRAVLPATFVVSPSAAASHFVRWPAAKACPPATLPQLDMDGNLKGCMVIDYFTHGERLASRECLPIIQQVRHPFKMPLPRFKSPRIVFN
jgi:hypothetical protein